MENMDEEYQKYLEDKKEKEYLKKVEAQEKLNQPNNSGGSSVFIVVGVIVFIMIIAGVVQGSISAAAGNSFGEGFANETGGLNSYLIGFFLLMLFVVLIGSLLKSGKK